jgi:hypothetical protein
VAVGPATRANSSLSGAALSRTRALAIDPVPGTSQSPQPRPCTAKPSASLDITNPYPERMYSHDANTKITIRRAGRRRERTSRTSASSITSSIRSLVNTAASTPIEIRSGNRSNAAFASRVTPATPTTIPHDDQLKKWHWGGLGGR